MVQKNINIPIDFDEIGFNVYSQTCEDGILLHIFNCIGFTNRRCVDIGASGIENSNVANLIINHAFDGLLIEGNESAVKSAKKQYLSIRHAKLFIPTVVNAYATMENVNGLLVDNGFSGSIDLLSIDIDGIDYWVWKAINAIDPRVVVVEYQDILGPKRSWTVPYTPAFNGSQYEVNRTYMNYGGASLTAFTKLANAKGYRLVGCNRGGWNAFFVNNSAINPILPEVSVKSCFRYPWNRYGMSERFPLVETMPWQEV